MRSLLKAFLLLAFLLQAVVTLYVLVMIRERYTRSGPIPARQAQSLLSPMRRRIHRPREMLEKFGVMPGDTVLELGPGPGYFTLDAAAMVGTGGRILCLDLQPEMLAVLQQRLDDAGIANAEPVAADAIRLPLADSSVHTAFLVAVLGEIPDRVAALQELNRVIKHGGVLAFSETLTDPDYVLQDTLRDLCRATGFEEVEVSGQPLGYTMTFRKRAAIPAPA